MFPIRLPSLLGRLKVRCLFGFSLQSTDEVLRVQEEASRELLRVQEEASRELLRVQEEASRELLRVQEEASRELLRVQEEASRELLHVQEEEQSTCRGDNTRYVAEIQNKKQRAQNGTLGDSWRDRLKWWLTAIDAGADAALIQVTNKPGELLGLHADSRQRMFKKGVVHSVECLGDI